MNKRRYHDDGRSSTGSKVYAIFLYTFLTIYTFVFLFGKSLLPPEETWCPYSKLPVRNGYQNPDYNYHPCHHYRTPYLLFLHLQEVDYAQRMMISLFLGGIIGFERRASERPAGIRTMCMVCLGSCFFSMCSQLAFKSSTMDWDAARVAAAVPSGVGFLGAGLIWKGNTSTVKNVDGKMISAESQEVHGLTTAASVWLAAAVGVAVGGGRRLYIVSVYGVMLVILVLRFGPQLYFARDAESQQDFDDLVDDDSEIDWDSITDESASTGLPIDDDDDDEEDTRRRPESTMWGSDKDINLGYPLSSKNLNGDGDDTEVGDQEQGIHPSWTRLPSMSSQHLSAPNLKIYETPTKDEIYETPIKDEKSPPQRRRKRRTKKNELRLSFHS